MRRSTIWILIALMVITFGALIALQVRYLSGTAQMASSQFDDGVKRSLIQTVTLLEENEALKYLAQTLEEEQYVQKKRQHTVWKSFQTRPKIARHNQNTLEQSIRPIAEHQTLYQTRKSYN